MLRDILPRDSILHHWLDAQDIVETPEAFDLICGCSIIGAVMRRDVHYDQIRFKIWPNIGALLVGPSGVGKDTAINEVEKQVLPLGRVPSVNGVSIEAITGQLASQGMGAGLLCAKEISALFGPKDWQSGILTQLTNIMSSGDVVNAGLRSDASRVIKKPTVTFLGGSTVEWLHSHMPEGANEGGFFPRCLVVVEYKNKQSVPLIDRLSKDRLDQASNALEQWTTKLRTLIDRYGQLGRFEFGSNRDARSYEDWYERRFAKFSAFAHAYAHRSRDNCLRLAMHSAMSCNRPVLLEEDVAFGAGVIERIAQRIDVIFAPPTLEAKIAGNLLGMLPAKEAKIHTVLAQRFRSREVEETFRFLLRTKQIVKLADDVVVKGDQSE